MLEEGRCALVHLELLPSSFCHGSELFHYRCMLTGMDGGCHDRGMWEWINSDRFPCMLLTYILQDLQDQACWDTNSTASFTVNSGYKEVKHVHSQIGILG